MTDCIYDGIVAPDPTGSDQMDKMRDLENLPPYEGGCRHWNSLKGLRCGKATEGRNMHCEDHLGDHSLGNAMTISRSVFSNGGHARSHSGAL